MSKKANVIEAKGVIYKESGNGYFNVELDEPEGHQCLCRASGRLITRKIQLLVGDRVTVELSPFDLTRGRITLRENKMDLANDAFQFRHAYGVPNTPDLDQMQLRLSPKNTTSLPLHLQMSLTRTNSKN